MIWLVATLAFADDPVQAARLLGPAPVEVAPMSAAPFGPALALPGWWPLGLAAVGAGLLWLARRNRSRGQDPFASQVVVIGRASLGGSASLVVVDVAEPGGAMRRLVVATGSGTPSLLADLGDDGAHDDDVAVSAPRATGAVGAYAASSPRPDRKSAALALIDEVVGNRRVGEP